MDKKKTNRLGWSVMGGEALMAAASIVPITYAYYCFTDIGKVSNELMTTAMMVVNIVTLIFSMVSGAIVQKTRTKYGMYRPWMFFGTIIMVAATFLMFYTGKNQLVTCIVIAAGYLIALMITDLQMTGKYGVYEKLSGGNSDARNLINGRAYTGLNLAYIVYSYVFLYAVEFLGGDNKAAGFRYVQVIITVIAVLGAGWIWKISRPYDQDNRTEILEQAENVKVSQMLKGIVTNRCMLGVILGDVFKNAGSIASMSMLIYQCESVLGDFLFYSTALALSSVAGVIGSMISPWLMEKIGGRKKATVLLMILAGISYGMMAVTGGTKLGLLIPLLLGTLFQYAADAVNILLYLDAGEYWYHKTGKDTRAYCMSMQNLTSKVANILVTAVLGWTLITIHYSEGAVLDVAGKRTLTMANGLLPAAGMLIFAISLLVIHNVRDKDIQRMIAENAEKDGTASEY